MASGGGSTKLPPLPLETSLSASSLLSGSKHLSSRKYTVPRFREEQIREWIDRNDTKRLERVVIAGKGDLLLREIASREETRLFLQRVPQLMSKVDILLSTAASGDVPRLRSLLDDRRYARSRDRTGSGLLHQAVAGGHTKMVEYLVTNYPEVLRMRNTGDEHVYNDNAAICSGVTELPNPALSAALRHHRAYRRHLRRMRLSDSGIRPIKCRLMTAHACCLHPLPPIEVRNGSSPDVSAALPRVDSHWAGDPMLLVGRKAMLGGCREWSSENCLIGLDQPNTQSERHTQTLPTDKYKRFPENLYCDFDSDTNSTVNTFAASSSRTKLFKKNTNSSISKNRVYHKRVTFARNTPSKLHAGPCNVVNTPAIAVHSSSDEINKPNNNRNDSATSTSMDVTSSTSGVNHQDELKEIFSSTFLQKSLDHEMEQVCHEVILDETVHSLVDRAISRALICVAEERGLFFTR